MFLSWNHSHLWKDAFCFAPLSSQVEHPAKYHQFTIDGADFHTEDLAPSCVSRNGLGPDFIERLVRQILKRDQVLQTVQVVIAGLELRRERRFDVRLKTMFGKVPQRHCGSLLPNTNFAFENLSSSSRFHLSSHPWVPLFGGLAVTPTSQFKFVPICPSAFVDHLFIPFLSVFFGRPPSLPHSFMRFLNSFLPHAFWRASTLRLPSTPMTSLICASTS